MSLQRALLRTRFVSALKNHTIAGGRVFDTRMSPLQETKPQDFLPLIAVYTDNDKRSQIEGGAPAGGFRRMIDVTLAYSIGSWAEVPADGEIPAGMAYGFFETDSELEMVLDLFELQIWRALYADGADALQGMVKQFHSFESTPGRDDSGQNKISARQLTISCEVADDCRRDFRYAGIDDLVAGLGDIAATPAFASLADMIAEIAGRKPLPAGTPLKRIIFDVDYINPADASLLPPGRTIGPDGRIDQRFNATDLDR